MLRLGGERTAELDALLQPVGQARHRRLADVLDLEELDDFLDRVAVLGLLAPGTRQLQRDFEEAGVHVQVAAGHDVVEHRHAPEQRDVLEGAGDAEAGGVRRRHVRQALAAKGDAAFLRHVDAVDDVEHRALAGAVRADDGAHLVLEHVEGDVRQRVDAAKAQRDRVELEDRRTDRKGALRRLQDGGLYRYPSCSGGSPGRARVQRLRVADFRLQWPLRRFRPRQRTSVRPSYMASTSGAVALRDDVAAQLAGAREHAVVGVQLLGQDGEAMDLRFRQRRFRASSALTWRCSRRSARRPRRARRGRRGRCRKCSACRPTGRRRPCRCRPARRPCRGRRRTRPLP